MVGLESQICYGVLNQKTCVEKNSLTGWLLRLKIVILYSYEEQKRDRSVPL